MDRDRSPEDLALIAHDLNRVLMDVLAGADMARRALTPDSPAWEYVLEIRNAALSGKVVVQRLTSHHAEPPPFVTEAHLSRTPRTVLVVDDDGMTREAMERFLRMEDYRVLGASNVDDALRAATEPIHALITDFRMEGGHGDELAELLRSRIPDLPVLYVTGWDPETAPRLKAALQRPRTAFLGKPVEAELLAGTVARLLDA